jgi:mRNA-degrading endonuclease RelE of RelBE toxin-antitoxin system
VAFTIEFSEDAERQLSRLKASDRTILIDAIEEQLAHQPTSPARHRKLLRANPLAAWELRVGDFRVFYNVEEEQALVILVAIGAKIHNTLYIEGEEFRL